MSNCIYNSKRYMDLTAKYAMDNVMRESRKAKVQAKPQHFDFIPDNHEAESKPVVYKLAWVAPELR